MSSFRVKVDLSKFFQDHRRISWVYVDTSKISYIKHLEEHIAKLFNIKQPFYLLCASTYLPFNENVHIVHNDNFLTLVPGTLVDNSSHSNGEWYYTNLKEPKEHFSQVSSAQASTFDEKEVQTDRNDQVISGNLFNGDITKRIPSDDTITDPGPAHNTMYHSILNETDVISETDSKLAESLITEDCSMSFNTPAKRKRTRRKKVKRLSDNIDQNICHENKKKPKIVDSIVITSGKHIRFNPDEEIVSQASDSPKNFDFLKRFCDTPGPKKTLSKNLDTLLALKQCSTPLSFSFKKIEKGARAEKTSTSRTEEDEESLTESARKIVVSNEIMNIDKNDDLQIESVDPEKYPLLDAIPKIGDFIAFKFLKLGGDYTPHVSTYIIGKILDVYQWWTSTSIVTIKVLRGEEEIQLPKGKFTLPDDKAESPTDVIKLNHKELLETRLICTN